MKASIEKSFTVPPCEVVIEANEDDIRRYVSRKLEMDENFTEMNKEDSNSFKKEIMDKIIETANGMFLLSALQIEIVLEQTSVSKRRAALASMPKKLEDAFQVTIDCIKSQASGKSNQGMEVLKWMYLAKRKLSVMELRHALATVHSTAECLDLDDLPFEKSLTECCHGLIVIDKETSSVRLVHKSLQDFLQDQYENGKLFETGHRDIAFTCLKYLSFSDESTSLSSTPVCDINAVQRLLYLSPNKRQFWDSYDTPSAHIDRFPLLAYAIHFWGCHARGNTDQEIEELAIQLLNQERAHSISRNLRSVLFYHDRSTTVTFGGDWGAGWGTIEDRLNTTSVLSSTTFVGLHIIAYFGLDEIYEALVKKLDNFDVNRRIFGMTALILAVKQGHYAVGKTPLFCAAEYGEEAVVRLLIEKGAQVDLKDQDGKTALLCAAQDGEKDVVRVLLEEGAQIDLEDKYGETALDYACANGR
ncbi:hypothetical protein FPQ18DRAFT_411062 [Pyronema domesticum]|nr:hypothetical protein FPQ18DRAFT_411062 [Pyronema domesticum]